jgi:hypothetical protein
MNSPVFIYYKLTNFFNNHRDYVKSRNIQQLKNKDKKMDKNTCEGAETISEIFDYNPTLYKSLNGTPLAGNSTAIPCGLAAKYYFRGKLFIFIILDKFSLSINNQNIIINETGIANTYQKNLLFKNLDDYNKTQWLDIEDEHFMVWMQMESFSEFMKIWGKINIDLNKGIYNISIDNGKNNII